MSALQERGPLPTGNFPFSECNPDMLTDMLDGSYVLDDSVDQYQPGVWALVTFDGGAHVEFNTDHYSTRSGEKHVYLELPDINTRANPVFELDDAEVIRDLNSLIFVAPIETEGNGRQWITWVTVTNHGSSIHHELREVDRVWHIDVPVEVQLAADRATARQAQRLVGAGNGS